jgi:hypothetical protein
MRVFMYLCDYMYVCIMKNVGLETLFVDNLKIGMKDLFKKIVQH